MSQRDARRDTTLPDRPGGAVSSAAPRGGTREGPTESAKAQRDALVGGLRVDARMVAIRAERPSPTPGRDHPSYRWRRWAAGGHTRTGDRKRTFPLTRDSLPIAERFDLQDGGVGGHDRSRPPVGPLLVDVEMPHAWCAPVARNSLTLT